MLAWLGKKCGITIATVISVVIAYNVVVSWYDSKISSAYAEGVSDTEMKWERMLDQQEKRSNQMKIGHMEEVKLLERRLADLQERLNKDSGEEKQNLYTASDAGRKSSIPRQVIDIYNDSINKEIK